MAVTLAVVIAALIVASVLVPPPRTRRVWVLGCALMGICTPLPVLALGAGRGAVGAGIAAGVALLAAATWLARGLEPGGGPEGTGGVPAQPPGPPPPWDWSDFDRARDDWSRPRTPA